MTIKIEKIEKEAEMKGIIRVKNYLYDGNIIYGIKDSDSDGFILEDGDIFEIKELIEDGYEVEAVTGKEIYEDGEKSANKSELEFLKKLRKILNEYHSEIPLIETGRQNVLNDIDNELKLDERIKHLEGELE